MTDLVGQMTDLVIQITDLVVQMTALVIQITDLVVQMTDLVVQMTDLVIQMTDAEKIIGEQSSYDLSMITHMSGTCRMGLDPQKSVVNSFCQSHDVPNLFVIDSSCFVTEGGGDSPSLTIQAIALRASDYLIHEAKQGHL